MRKTTPSYDLAGPCLPRFMGISRFFRNNARHGAEPDNTKSLYLHHRKDVAADSHFILNMRRMPEQIEDIASDRIDIKIVFNGDMQQLFHIIEKNRTGKFIGSLRQRLDFFLLRRVLVADCPSVLRPCCHRQVLP